MNQAVNLSEFPRAFLDEAACIAYLEHSRWGGRPAISPFTGGEAYRISSRPGTYKCKDTRQNFSVRHGTIFEGSHLPLKKWFFAIFLLGRVTEGLSSIQLGKYLGVTQRTAWFLLSRLRFAIQHEEFKKDLDDPGASAERAPSHERASVKGRADGQELPAAQSAKRGAEQPLHRGRKSAVARARAASVRSTPPPAGTARHRKRPKLGAPTLSA